MTAITLTTIVSSNRILIITARTLTTTVGSNGILMTAATLTTVVILIGYSL